MCSRVQTRGHVGMEDPVRQVPLAVLPNRILLAVDPQRQVPLAVLAAVEDSLESTP